MRRTLSHKGLGSGGVDITSFEYEDGFQIFTDSARQNNEILKFFYLQNGRDWFSKT